MRFNSVTSHDQNRALIISTVAYTICFAVWTIFSILGIKIKQDFQLSDTQFGLLVAMPILTGSLSRLLFGIWTDQFGGRLIFTIVMLVSAICTWLMTLTTHYWLFILAALGLGLSGGSFSVGVAYVSNWYPLHRQGTALGIFGLGNVGGAITNFGAPFLLIAFGWQGVAKIYALLLVLLAIIFFWVSKEDPALTERREKNLPAPKLSEQLTPLKKLQVWRFSYYYFFVFGAFVALTLWLPIYYMSVYHVSIEAAGLLAALYALPASVFRALGGWLSDRYGARIVMYWTFITSAVCTFILSYPPTDYIVHGVSQKFYFSLHISIVPFVILTFMLGFFMSLGKAAVYKYIPAYYPSNVGSVGGVVGCIGGLGGFILPVIFGAIDNYIGVWTSCFMLLFVLSLSCLIIMHLAIELAEQKRYTKVSLLKDPAEILSRHKE